MAMGKVSIIGLDLAKNAIQAHGADETGAVAFRRKVSRSKLLEFLAKATVAERRHSRQEISTPWTPIAFRRATAGGITFRVIGNLAKNLFGRKVSENAKR
jgi:hypothetical protein